MPTFAYVAISGDGAQSQGAVNLPNREALLTKLRNANLTPISIRQTLDTGETTEAQPAAKATPLTLSLPGKVSRKELMVFTRQLATTLNAGLPLIRILHVVANETQSRRVRELLASFLRKSGQFRSLKVCRPTHPLCTTMCAWTTKAI